MLELNKATTYATRRNTLQAIEQCRRSERTHWLDHLQACHTPIIHGYCCTNMLVYAHVHEVTEQFLRQNDQLSLQD